MKISQCEVLIFKAGELPSILYVQRLTVSLYWSLKKIMPRKIKGNLAKFQYQIILDEMAVMNMLSVRVKIC